MVWRATEDVEPVVVLHSCRAAAVYNRHSLGSCREAALHWEESADTEAAELAYFALAVALHMATNEAAAAVHRAMTFAWEYFHTDLAVSGGVSAQGCFFQVLVGRK
jgi:hypothetical protein